MSRAGAAGAPALTEPREILLNWDVAPFAEGLVTVGPLEVVVAATGAGSGRRLDLTVRNPGRHPVTLGRVGVRIPAWPERVLEHGCQGASVVRRCDPVDTRPERADLPDWVKAAHLSDPGAAGASVAGDPFLLTTMGLVGFLDGGRHLGTVAAGRSGITATALLDDVVLDPGAERRLDPLWLADGAPGPVYSELAALWGGEAGARVGAPSLVGWSSWHQFATAVTPADVRANLLLAAEHDLEVVEVGAGYEAALGDWLLGADEWVDGTAKVAADIRLSGLRAGLWTAPFLVGAASALFRDHPGWVAGALGPGGPLEAGEGPEAWPGPALALDTTRPEVLDHLRETYRALVEQGFDRHRVDYGYAAALPGLRHDRQQTRAQALRAGLEAVREGVGDDAFLVASRCPFGPAVGVVDAMRVSPPVAPTWSPRRHWPGLEEAAVAAVNAVRASVLRAPLHRRVFLNDPDCLLLRPVATRLEAWQRSFLVAVVTGCGAFTVLSDDLALYTGAEWALLDALRLVLPGVDTPLDLEDPFADPLVVRSRAGTKLTVDWHGRGPDGPTAQLGIA